MNNILTAIEGRLGECMLSDRGRLRHQLGVLRRRLHEGKSIDHGLTKLQSSIATSTERLRQRRALLPIPEFSESLPINQSRDRIATAIRDNQVVVVCGETGSGKTTQLPKICLALGLGAAGIIGHTQPRRIAARTVAARISEELGAELGGLVGYKVRFSDRGGPNIAIKLMTDGILLAETQGDRDLREYEVIIIDEAHERSLNIDFLLGYLHRLLPRRPDLKVIITSATIDPERFARHFGNAPIIEVSGRTFPVDIRYRPLLAADEEDRDRDQLQAILDAVDELSRIDRGDILIFLSGEREIRETAEGLRKHHPPNTEILPLYARLSIADQSKVFAAHGKRRIVLATNVAETSLTVPGIRYVIDPGTARISRYSYRSKVQRLPIESISQASANQRAGRCGRINAGVCVRLYSEEDFDARPAFTDPEIQRTNLAAVILQMVALKLGDVAAFPFVEPPDTRLVNDGYQLLFELQAVDERRRITALGRQLARLPVDPRLGRMILAASREGCVREVLIIASALAIQDPRDRPLDHRQAADEKHRRFQDDRSDFSSFLRMWDFYHEQARHRSRNQMRSLCREEFLSFVRMREWHDLHQQLLARVSELGMHPSEVPAEYEPLHRALLSGLLSHVGLRDRGHSWLGARNRQFHIFPGSGLFKPKSKGADGSGGSKWVMAAELVQTNRLYARTVARINPIWIEALAPHLVKRSYSEPHWEKRGNRVAATERVTMYGLPIVTGRKVNFGPISPAEAREIFIRQALVAQDIRSNAPFLEHNRALIEQMEELEAKCRRRDLLADDEVLFRFYDERLPADIHGGPGFDRWRRRAERDQPRLLFLPRELLMAREEEPMTSEKFPDILAVGELRLPLVYRFEPGEANDGVTLTVPLAAVNQIESARLGWLVPGLLAERMTALLRSLPKSLRRHFVPVPDYARALMESLVPGARDLTSAMAERLFEMTGVRIPQDGWDPEAVPVHLRMNVVVTDPSGRELAVGRDFEAIRRRLGEQARERFAELVAGDPVRPGANPVANERDHWFEHDSVSSWDFGDLPEQVEFARGGVTLKGYPALVDESGRVALRLLDTPESAQQATRAGMRRLFALCARDKVKYLRRQLPGLQKMSLHFVGVGSQSDLVEDLLAAIVDRAFLGDGPVPRTRAAFEDRLSKGRERLIDVANQICGLAGVILGTRHEVCKSMNTEMPPGAAEALQDIRSQLDHLVYVGFMSHTPYERLQHLPRYLKAIAVRLRKLTEAPDRDRVRRADIERLWLMWSQRSAMRLREQIRDPELETFRWMLEELRVSQFAQELRTPSPVSVKRLEQQWQAVKD